MKKIYNCNGIGTIDIGMSIKRRKKTRTKWNEYLNNKKPFKRTNVSRHVSNRKNKSRNKSNKSKKQYGKLQMTEQYKHILDVCVRIYFWL